MRKTKKLDSGRVVSYGWDKPLASYFAVVGEADGDDVGEVVDLWIGTVWKEIETSEILADQLKEFYQLSEKEMEELNLAKKRNPAAAEPSCIYQKLNPGVF